MSDHVIGDPRPAGTEGPAGDQRKPGQAGPAGDTRPAGQEKPKSSGSSDTKTDDASKATKKTSSRSK